MSTKQKQPAVQHEGQGIYLDLVLMCLPLIGMATCFYGLRVLLLCGVSVLTANLCDRFVALLRHQTYEKGELSSEAFALMLTLLMPATVEYYVVVVGTLAAVLLAKEAFGGYGAYVFHPTAVGYAVVAACWPDQLFRYPEPNLFQTLPLWDVSGVTLVESPTHILREGGLPTLDDIDLVLGSYPGAMGTTMLLVIVACALYLLHRRSIRLAAPVAFLAASAIIAFLMPRTGGVSGMPWNDVAERLLAVKYELCSAGMLYGAVFLLNDPITLPQNRISQVVYGAVVGVACMMFRYYGTFETGVCFALLTVNPISGWLNRAVAKITNPQGGVRRDL